MIEQNILFLALLSLILGSIILMFTPSHRHDLLKKIALTFLCVAFLLTLLLWFFFNKEMSYKELKESAEAGSQIFEKFIAEAANRAQEESVEVSSEKAKESAVAISDSTDESVKEASSEKTKESNSGVKKLRRSFSNPLDHINKEDCGCNSLAEKMKEFEKSSRR